MYRAFVFGPPQKKMKKMEGKMQCRLLSYNIYNNITKDDNKFQIQMFGLELLVVVSFFLAANM